MEDLFWLIWDKLLTITEEDRKTKDDKPLLLDLCNANIEDYKKQGTPKRSQITD